MSSIYIHIPFCKSKCHYCNFYSVASFRERDRIVKNISEELFLRKDYLESNKLETIYFGGGTPSILNKIELEKIFNTLRNNYKWSKNIEITIEVNPDDINEESIKFYKELGINRVSLGIQSFDSYILKSINRIHSGEDAINAIHLIKKSGINNISIDLIYAIPGLSNDLWLSTLNIFKELEIPHLSSYFLTVENKTALEVLIRKGKFPNINEKLGMEQYDMLVNFMEDNDYEQYEISNFSLKGFRSKHNSNYWLNSEYLGIGPSAHSYNLKSRQWNPSAINKYCNNIENLLFYEEIEYLDIKDTFNEYLMLSLRTIWGIDIDYIKNYFGDFYLNYLEDKIISKKIERHIIKENNNIKIRKESKKFADGIASELFIM